MHLLCGCDGSRTCSVDATAHCMHAEDCVGGVDELKMLLLMPQKFNIPTLKIRPSIADAMEHVSNSGLGF